MAEEVTPVINAEKCNISRTKRIMSADGTLINEIVTSISGNNLSECYTYYKKVNEK